MTLIFSALSLRLCVSAGATAAALLLAAPAPAQNVITTAVGADWLFPSGARPALQAPLGGSSSTPLFVAAELNGAYYIADPDNFLVFRVDAAGTLRIVAGNGIPGHSGDGGPATAAAIGPPTCVALDGRGGFYIAFADRIRRVAANGTIETVAGATDFAVITGIAVDSAGRILVAEGGARRVRAISVNGAVSTLADGLTGPVGVAADLEGNIWIADAAADGTGVLRSLDRNGRLGTSLAAVTNPSAIALDGGGNVFIADARQRAIVRFNPAYAMTTTVAGSGGFAASAISLDVQGNIFAADNAAGRIRRISVNGTAAVVAGNGAYRSSGDGGAAAGATIFRPSGLAFDSAGALYIAEPERNRVRRIAANGAISSLAPDDTGFSGPAAVAVDASGTVYVSDTLNSRIRAVAANGTSRTVAGPELLVRPRGIALDAAGNLYVADGGAHRVWRIAPDGTPSLVAGTGQRGFAGENNSAATQAQFNVPTGIAIDAAGATVWIADTLNGRVRRVRGGAIVTVAEGLGRPTCLALDRDGAVYVSEEGGHRVRRIDPSGALRTVAGTGTAGYSGDGGPADRATINGPWALAFDAAGSLWIADQLNHRIRRVLAVPPTLNATPAQLPAAVVRASGEAKSRVFFVTSSVPGLPFTVSANRDFVTLTPSSGTAPAAVEVKIDPARARRAPGDATLTVASPAANPTQRILALPVRVEVVDRGGLVFETPPLDYALFEGGETGKQVVTIFNSGSSEAVFLAAAVTRQGWLRVSPQGGAIPPGGRVTIETAADPGVLVPGTYTGRVVVTEASGGGEIALAANATVSSVPRSLLLSHSGLTFSAVVGGAATPPQTVGVFNQGRGSLAWTAAASGLAEAAPWLGVSREAGSDEFTVAVNHAGLAAGDYYGQVQVSAPDADNSPQVVLVVLTVLPSGSTPTPVPLTTTMIFTAPVGGSSPGAQTVTFANLTNRQFTYASGRLVRDGGAVWFTHAPASGAIAGGQTANVLVQPFTAGLAPGVYRGSFTLQFDNGTPRTVNLVLILTGGAAAGPRKGGPREAGECEPTSLAPVFTSILPEVAIPAGWPSHLTVRVVDNCGAPMTDGQVTATFSNNTPALKLISLKDGNWAGTWQVRDSAAAVTIQATAEQPARRLRGTAEITGTIRANAAAPVFGAAPVVSAATLDGDAPLAPGMLVTITGSRLARGAAAADSFPLPERLNGTLVAMGGRALPLLEVAEDRIAAIVPFDVPVNARQQILVQSGTAATAPETVTVASAQPGVFTRERTGSGQGLVFRVAEDGSLVPADVANPARAGDRIVARCTGLGAVEAPVSAAAAAPADPPARVLSEIALSIGGVEARVESAVLEPGAAGVYLVRAIVPQGVAAGDTVAVVVRTPIRSSPPVTMAVR